MDIIKAIKNRKSFRSFKPDPVPRNIITEILETSMKIPSAMNSQPCCVTVISEATLRLINDGNMKKLSAGEKPDPDIKHKPYEGIYRERAKKMAAQLFNLLGIDWGDKEKRMQWRQKGFRFYDAPVALILHIDSAVAQSQALMSTGMLCQNICLTALNYELGTCIQDMGVAFPDVIRTYTNIPENRHIAISISIGYPDWNDPVNQIKVDREPFKEMVTWLSDN